MANNPLFTTNNRSVRIIFKLPEGKSDQEAVHINHDRALHKNFYQAVYSPLVYVSVYIATCG